MKKNKNERGFIYFEFDDTNGVACSVQESSNVEPCIRFGSDKLGIREFVPELGWMNRTEFDEDGHHYIGNNRMHLNQSQVKKLLPLLKRFVETGKLT